MNNSCRYIGTVLSYLACSRSGCSVHEPFTVMAIANEAWNAWPFVRNPQLHVCATDSLATAQLWRPRLALHFIGLGSFLLLPLPPGQAPQPISINVPHYYHRRIRISLLACSTPCSNCQFLVNLYSSSPRISCSGNAQRRRKGRKQQKNRIQCLLDLALCSWSGSRLLCDVTCTVASIP